MGNRGRTTRVERDATIFMDHYCHSRHLCPNLNRKSFQRKLAPKSRSNLLSKQITKERYSILVLVKKTSAPLFDSWMEIATPVKHIALDVFEKSSILIKYEGSYQQDVFPHVRCWGPQLDIFVTAEAKVMIFLNRFILIVKAGTYMRGGGWQNSH